MPIDPVCGMTVDPATAAGSTEYQGTTYYFCARNCLERFTRDPGAFLEAARPAAMPPAEAADTSKIKIPLMCHFAQHDDWCTPAAVDALEKRMKEGHVPFDLFRYDAKHGFMRDGSDVYDETSAEAAWERTAAFLKKTLKAG